MSVFHLNGGVIRKSIQIWEIFLAEDPCSHCQVLAKNNLKDDSQNHTSLLVDGKIKWYNTEDNKQLMLGCMILTCPTVQSEMQQTPLVVDAKLFAAHLLYTCTVWTQRKSANTDDNANTSRQKECRKIHIHVINLIQAAACPLSTHSLLSSVSPTGGAQREQAEIRSLSQFISIVFEQIFIFWHLPLHLVRILQSN